MVVTLCSPVSRSDRVRGSRTVSNFDFTTCACRRLDLCTSTLGVGEEYVLINWGRSGTSGEFAELCLERVVWSIDVCFHHRRGGA
jgi:hypothetical protein